MNAVFLLPVNLYGPGDNFDPRSSHVIPAVIRKCVEAVRQRRGGNCAVGRWLADARILAVEDAAEGIVLATRCYHGAAPVNLGSGMEISIGALAQKIAELTGFSGRIVWDYPPAQRPAAPVAGREPGGAGTGVPRAPG